MDVKKNSFFLYIIFFIALSMIITFRLFAASNIFNQLIIFINLNILFIILLYHIIKMQIKKNKNSLFLILAIAVFVKIILMMFMHQIIIFPDELNTYDSFSWEYAQIWSGEDIIPINNFNNIHNIKYYFYFVSAIYYVFGHSIIIAKLFNVFLSVLGGFLIYLITKELFDDELISKIALILVLFFPFTVFWTLPLLRDGFNLFIMTVLFFLSIQLIKTHKIRYVLLLLVFIYVLCNTRFYIAMIIIFAIITQLFLMVYKRKKILAIILASGIIGIAGATIFFAPGLIEKNNDLLKLNAEYLKFKYISFEYLNHQREYSAVGNYGFLVNEDISTFKKAMIFLPKGLAYFFFAPFPWNTNGIQDLMTLPDTLLWYCFLPFIVFGLFMTYNKKKAMDCSAIIIACFLIVLLYSLIDGNIWLLHRHRTQATYFLLIFGAVGLSYFINVSRNKFKVFCKKHKSI